MGVLIEKCDYAQVIHDVDIYIKGFIDARNDFARFFCKERGWDINNLAEYQIEEIKKHPHWVYPDITILPYGHLTEQDEQMLRHYCAGQHIAFDIGTFLGRSAAIMSQCVNTFVFTFDNYKDEYFGDCYNNFQILEYKLKSYGNVLYRNPDYVTDEEISDLVGVVDVLFIDGDHTYAGVSKDFKRYFKYLKSKGFLLFHDSSPRMDVFPDVTRFANELIESNKEIELIERANGYGGSITAFMKV